MRDRLTIQTRTSTTDTHGGRSVAWSTLVTVWGRMRPLTAWSTERADAQKVGSQMTYEAEIRYRADVTPRMRLTWSPYTASTTKTFEIASVVPKAGRPDRLLLTCAEVV